jgi:hypothetical protein
LKKKKKKKKKASVGSSSSSSSSPSFVCNSDRLYYDDYIPVLDLDDQLQANQIYFVLPASKLRQRLTASDMHAKRQRLFLEFLIMKIWCPCYERVPN